MAKARYIMLISAGPYGINAFTVYGTHSTKTDTGNRGLHYKENNILSCRYKLVLNFCIIKPAKWAVITSNFTVLLDVT